VEKIGRNEPCLCGSGKKYKKCCLVKEQELASRKREESAVAGTALDWLAGHCPDGVREAVQEGFYRGLKNAEREALNELSSSYHELLNVNLGEWLITDARIRSGEEVMPVRELLLGSGGPNLSAGARQWLDNLGECPISLYEVRRLVPGERMLLADLVLPDEPEVWVSEKVATTSLLRWDIIGARLVRKGDELILSGAVYPFEREEAKACLPKIARKVKKEERGSDSSREIIGDIIRKEWLKSLVVERSSSATSETGLEQSPSAVSGYFQSWTDEANPALDGKTPLESVKSAAGRRSVLELLKTHELSDARRVRDQGGEPFDFGFLWERLGLSREGV